MRLGGRLAAAGEVLRDVEERRRPVADALKDWGLAHRFAGSGDRAAIGNIVYDALRRKRSIGWVMGSDEPEALAEGALYRSWRFDARSLAEALEGDQHAPALRGGYDPSHLEDAPPAVRADVPDWAVAELDATFDGNWEAEAQALAERPPLDLRANTLKASRERVVKELARYGAEPAPHAPEGVRIAAGEGASRVPNVTAEEGYRKGRFEVQDAGSQLVALLGVPDRAGGQVLDYCAGGGGKTLAIAAAMGNAGQVHAYDGDRQRLAPIHERLARAGVRSVQVHRAGSDLSDLQGRMDTVLVDAPCTGTGTWRRRPDAKWRLRETTIERRHQEQDEVLDQAAPHVRPGGALVYVTCSLLASENGDRVQAFLRRNAEFEVVGTEGRSDAFDTTPKRDVGPSGRALTPLTTGTDGFFAAVLRRRDR